MVRGIVSGALLFERVDGCTEGQPLGDAQGQLAFALHLLHDEEVFPIGVVLRGGEAVGDGVGHCEFEAAAPLRFAAGRNVLSNEFHPRGFAEDAGRLALGVAIDLATCRVGGSAGNASGGECCRVGDGDVSIDAAKDGGMACCDGVDIASGGQSLVGPEGVIPAATRDPVTLGCAGRGELNAPLHFGEGGAPGEVDLQLDHASVAEMHMRIVEAGHDKGAVEIDLARGGAGEGQAAASLPGGHDLAVAKSKCGDEERFARGEILACQYMAVVVDGVGVGEHFGGLGDGRALR